jgi:hypothetical protein
MIAEIDCHHKKTIETQQSRLLSDRTRAALSSFADKTQGALAYNVRLKTRSNRAATIPS